jgi:hypothetical protein
MCTYKATVELEVSYAVEATSCSQEPAILKMAAITTNALSVFPALLHAVFLVLFIYFFLLSLIYIFT